MSAHNHLLSKNSPRAEKNVLINRKTFFNSIAKILSFFEKDEFVCKESITSDEFDDGDLCNVYGSSNSRTYTICLGKNSLIAHTLPCSYAEYTNGCLDKHDFDLDVYVKIHDARDLITPLTTSYPYLATIVSKIEAVCISTNGQITEDEILMLAQNHIKNSHASKRYCIKR